MKFKVGDKVKIVNKRVLGMASMGSMDQYLGKTMTIEEVTQDAYRMKEDYGEWVWFDNMIAYKVEFTKSDLKDGDIVTYRYGDKRTLIKNTFECHDFGKSISVLENYNEDLTMKNGNKGMDIVKVERPTKYKTVFERKEEILDEAEKRYLRDVIRPFRDKVDYIQKWRYSTGVEFIKIKTHRDVLTFPDLDEKKKMYKGMEADKKYTLEELRTIKE